MSVSVTVVAVSAGFRAEGDSRSREWPNGSVVRVPRQVADRLLALGAVVVSSAQQKSDSPVPVVPDQAPDSSLGPLTDLDGMTVRELREFARTHSIAIPASVRTRDRIAAHIKENHHG